jgi:membrane associated rhomboid family serine protease
MISTIERIFGALWLLTILAGGVAYGIHDHRYAEVVAAIILISVIGYSVVKAVYDQRRTSPEGRRAHYIVSGASIEPKTPVTKVIIGVCIAASIVGWILPNHWYVSEGAVGYTPVMIHHEWWRLVTSAFLHENATHLLMNMTALWFVGREVEKDLGAKSLVLIYCAAALGGGIAVVAFGQERTLGASGAIYGLLGATFCLGVRAFLDDHRKSALRIMRIVGVVIAINLLFSVAIPFISLAAHVGGLVTGFIVTLFVPIPAGLRKAWGLTDRLPPDAHLTFDGTTNAYYYHGPAIYAVEAGIINHTTWVVAADHNTLPPSAPLSELDPRSVISCATPNDFVMA